MEHDEYELALDLMVELRKEIIEAQRIRAQVVGFKITFVSASIGLILANSDKIPNKLLIIPALAAIFFDLLLNSYSFSIKRIGSFLREYIEPILKKVTNWPEKYPLWEEYMSLDEVKQNLSLIGNLGITILAVIPALLVLVNPFKLISSLPLIIILFLFVSYDIYASFRTTNILVRKKVKMQI